MAREGTAQAAAKKKVGARGGGRGRAAKPRQRDGEVLEAAAKVFYRNGYADASVQDVADELGILKGSLYHYIDTKEDLLFSLLSNTHEDVQAILDEVEAMDLPPLEKLREYIRRQVEYTSKNLVRMTIYYHDVDQLSTKRRQEVVDQRHTHEQFVAGRIAEAQDAGIASSKIDPRMATNFLFGSMIWVYRWYRPASRLDPDAVAGDCADFVLHGVVGQVASP